jgi:antitoxin Phd
VNIKNLVSISEANQNFSKVARLVDAKGMTIILKNNAPRYVLVDYALFEQSKIADDADFDAATVKSLKRQIKAFEELGYI